MIVVEDGAGSNPDAVSYVDPLSDWAVAYTSAWRYKDEWTAATDDEKEQACILATRTLDSEYDWGGTPVRVGVQALGWPRVIKATTRLVIPYDAVPTPIKAATLELALALLQRNRTSDTANGEAEITSIGVGDGALRMDFGADPTAAAVQYVIPMNVQNILRNYGYAAGGAMVRVYRA